MDKIIPSSLKDFTSFKHKHVEYYEGIEGLKKVYLDTLSSKTNLISTLQPSEVEPELYKWLTTEYVKERVKRNVFAYVFIATNKKDKALEDYIGRSREELRIVHAVKQKAFPFEMEVISYDDKVAFLQFNPKYPLNAILIEHKPIANTVRSIFLNYLWKS